MSFFKRTEEKGVTLEEIRNLIIELNLPSSILELYDGCCKNLNLQDQFSNPHAILCLSKKQQNNYHIDRYKPILDFYFETIIAYDVISKKYVTYSIEMFDEKLLNPMSWDSIFIPIVKLWWETEISDEIILSYGEILGIRYTDLILENIKYFDDSKMSLKEESKFLEDLRIKIGNLP